MNMDLYYEADEAERSVLGAMLEERGCIGEVCDYLLPRDFHREEHRTIYSCAVYLYSIGKPVDVLSVSAHLRETGRLRSAGGTTYISGLTDAVPDITSIRHYADMVRSAFIRRSLTSIAESIKNSTEEPPRETLNSALEELLALSNKSSISMPERLSSAIDKEMKRALSRYDTNSTDEYTLTGFTRLDSTMLGMKPGDLIVVAARPSVGKSAFCTNIGINVARQGKPVLFLSLEMSTAQLSRRILAMESGVSYSRIDGNLLSTADIASLKEAEASLRTLPLIIDDKMSYNLAEIRTAARREQAKSGLSLLIIDYLQLACVDPSDMKDISIMSKGLKQIAKDLKIPVIAVSQMSRYIEHRDDKTPTLSDLRSSGQIEQDADLVGFLWHPGETREHIQFLIAKNRNGPCGSVDFKINHSLTKYYEMPKGGENVS